MMERKQEASQKELEADAAIAAYVAERDAREKVWCAVADFDERQCQYDKSPLCFAQTGVRQPT